MDTTQFANFQVWFSQWISRDQIFVQNSEPGLGSEMAPSEPDNSALERSRELEMLNDELKELNAWVIMIPVLLMIMSYVGVGRD